MDCVTDTSSSNADVTKYYYDEYGNSAKTVNASADNINGTVESESQYDTLNRVVSQTTDEGTTTYDYYVNDLVEKEVNTKGVETEYTYDQYSRTLTEKFNDYTYNYNTDGNVDTIYIKDTKYAEYTYNDDNQAVSLTYANGDKIRYEYDSNGNLVKQYRNNDTNPYIVLTYSVVPAQESTEDEDAETESAEPEYYNSAKIDYDTMRKTTYDCDGNVLAVYDVDENGNTVGEALINNTVTVTENASQEASAVSDTTEDTSDDTSGEESGEDNTVTTSTQTIGGYTFTGEYANNSASFTQKQGNTVRSLNFSSDTQETAVENSTDGTNLFVYCNNDPVNNTDPTGYLSKIDAAICLVTFIIYYVAPIRIKDKKGKYKYKTKRILVDSMDNYIAKITYYKTKLYKKSFVLSFGDQSSWKKAANINKRLNMEFVNNQAKYIQSEYNKGTTVSLTNKGPNVIGINIASATIAMYLVSKKIKVDTIKKYYNKVWGNKKQKVIKWKKSDTFLFCITNGGKKLNGWYAFRVSNWGVKKL